MGRDRKVANVIRTELAPIVLEIVEPQFGGLITVSDVVVTKDIGIAKVYIAYTNNTKSDKKYTTEDIIDFLQENIYEIQGQMNRLLQIKKNPRLRFYADNSADRAEGINALLGKIKNS